MSRRIAEIRLFRDDFVNAIAEAASGEGALDHFEQGLVHQGFAPSRGYDSILDDAAVKLTRWGYDAVQVIGFPSDGKSYAWACRTEPGWDVEEAELSMILPCQRLLARFSEKRMCLGRFSGPTDVRASLVHVGEGTRPGDYDGVDVRGKMVLAWGRPDIVFQRAVWERGSLGLIWYRREGESRWNNTTQVVYTLPSTSLDSQQPVTFCFSLSYNAARDLIALLERGEEVLLHAMVKSEVYPSQLKVACGVLKGMELQDQEIWFLGHCDHRNTGGFNNLSGYGTTLEIARVLSTLIQNGTLPRPRRTLRFFFGAEHHAVINYFYHRPEHIRKVFAALNLDMVGMYKGKTGARLRISRTPHSAPHFINDAAAFFLDYIEERNGVDACYGSVLNPNQPPEFSESILAPSGSQDTFNSEMIEYSGPSDQDDLMDGSIRIPTLTISEWPDPVFHTDLDSIDLVDPTQVRRIITMTGALGYYIANVDTGDYPFLIVNGMTRAQGRAGAQLRRAVEMVEKAGSEELPTAYYEAANIIVQTWRREREALQSLVRVGIAVEDDDSLARALGKMESEEQWALQELQAVARHKCEAAGMDPRFLSADAVSDPDWAAFVPQRIAEIRGPINLHRHQYGQWWLYNRLGDLDFARLPLALDGLYYPYEALNCADGERTIREIRDVVCAEYGPVPVEHFHDYFVMLAQAGVVCLK